MRVLVDIDDVQFPWTQYAHEACLGAGITNGGTPTRWGFQDDYGVTVDELWTVLYAAYQDGMLLRPFYPGAGEQMARLHDAGHTIHIATARGFESDPEVANLVRQHTVLSLHREGIPHDTLTFAKDKTVLGADAAADDSLTNCFSLESAGTSAFLVEQPHNQSGIWSRRVDNLEHFVDLICDTRLDQAA